MSTGRQAENQQAGGGIPKRGHGFAPVSPVEISATLDFGHVAAVSNQTGATLAGHDLLIEGDKTFGLFGFR